MNMAQARREAHSRVASLIRVNAEFDDSDLWDALNDLEDKDRIANAFAEIGDYHAKKGQKAELG